MRPNIVINSRDHRCIADTFIVKTTTLQNTDNRYAYIFLPKEPTPTSVAERIGLGVMPSLVWISSATTGEIIKNKIVDSIDASRFEYEVRLMYTKYPSVVPRAWRYVARDAATGYKGTRGYRALNGSFDTAGHDQETFNTYYKFEERG